MDYIKSLRRSKSKKAPSANTEKENPSAGATAAASAAATSNKESKPLEPVLSKDDEEFLHQIVSAEGTPPPLPERHPLPQDLPEAGSTQMNNAQIAIISNPQDDQPSEPPKKEVGEADIRQGQKEDAELVEVEGKDKDRSKEKEKAKDKERKSRFSGIFNRGTSIRKKAAASDLHSAAEGLKSPTSPAANDGTTVSDLEAKKEQEEIAAVLEQLNLAAENNRVFSISDESKELLRKFTLVLKDLVNGVPTAYHDLESLLTNSEETLTKIYDSLPEFLQSLIEKLPSRFSEKFTESVGPEVLATAAKKHGLSSESAGKAASMAEKTGVKIKVPSLKELVTKQGAIASLLRAIVGFIRQRFPALLGVNVVWSMALFVLLLIFWYCHKRGREVRLEKERKVTEEEMAALKSQVEAEGPAEYEPPSSTDATSAPKSTSNDPSSMALVLASSDLTTTAPKGASIEAVREGIREAITARENELRNRALTEGATTTEGYAEGGSLAKALKEDGERAKDGKEDISAER